MRIGGEIDLPARMRDGTTLRANVYRPEGDGPWPTLLTRLPYGKDDAGVLTVLDPVQAARRGFMVVIQDCRGRFASEGEWIPFWFEEQDGYDTVEWAARLPGSNRRVGMYGESYFGNTQWLAAVGQPPSLAAISPALTWSEPMDGLFRRGGAFELGVALPWSLQTGMNYLERAHRDIAPVIDEYDRLVEGGYDQAVLNRHGLGDTGLFRSLDDPAFAARTRIAGRHSSVTVPSFHTAGWHDLFLQGTLDNYAAMSALGREARLLVGPWTHATFADPTGDEADSQFRHDPADPVPTHGGSHLMSPAFPAGPWDQSRIEQRDDVLVFTSAPLERELEVTGRVRAILHAESSDSSADWVVRLCDVHPDGRSLNLCDGILRAGGGVPEIDLWSTSNLFLKGHRLRVQVTSSCFPRWDRNPIAGERRIHHDASRPSYIDLPVVP